MKIFFAHNSHNRPKTLKNTVKIEKDFFPDSECFLSLTENGGIDQFYFSDLMNTKTFKTFGNTWQLGCVNSFYSLISKICENEEDGIIIFSHDDVFLKDYNVVIQNINKMITENISFIVRKPREFFGDNYYMMEVVYLRLSHVKEFFTPFNNSLFHHESMITKDVNNTISAESWLHTKLVNAKNGLVIEYTHHGSTNEEINENLNENLGYEHINLGKNGWQE